MLCEDVEPQIETLAAGDRVDPVVLRHLDECARCRESLALARELEQLLAQRPPVEAPARFVAQVHSRIRSDRWRREQYLDLGFNLMVAAGLLAVFGGVWVLLNLTGLTALGGEASTLFGEGLRVLQTRVMSSLPTYAAAIVLLLMTVGVWWWVESTT